MTVGAFSGETAEFYAKYRRGYPTELITSLAERLNLGGEDHVLDLGCGTGQLTLPLAKLVRLAVGMDPEADMLRLARERAGRMGIGNVVWVLGSDTDVGTLGNLGSFADRRRRVLGDVAQPAAATRGASGFRRAPDPCPPLGRTIRGGGRSQGLDRRQAVSL